MLIKVVKSVNLFKDIIQLLIMQLNVLYLIILNFQISRLIKLI